MSRIGRVIGSAAASAVMAGSAMTVLAAVPAHAADAATSYSASSSAGGSCDRKVILGNSRYRGDIFHSAASTAWVQHNHVGIYYTTGAIVEAPGGSYSSWVRTASTHRVCATAHKMHVLTTQANRDKAARYAYYNLRGKPYDRYFYNNKTNGDSKLNCSELVWKAYKRATGFDLDYNGGPGVYPNDIKNHSRVSIYQTIR